METTNPEVAAAAAFLEGEEVFLGDAAGAFFFLAAGFLTAGSALAATVLSSLFREADRLVRAIAVLSTSHRVRYRTFS